MSEYRVVEGSEIPSLALRNTRVLKALESDEEYVLEAETFTPADSDDGLEELPEACPKCGTMYDYKGIGRIDQQVKDTPIHGKRVRLMLKRRRYQCRSCKATFMEKPAWLHDERRATTRLVDAIQKDIFLMPNSHVANKYGVDDKTVKNIFDDFVRSKESLYTIETPRVLGIDELYILKKPRGVFTNIEQRTIIEMKQDRNVQTVIDFINTLDKSKIEIVTADMWNGYRRALRTALPDAQVVVDKFHVQRQANYVLEKVRRGMRAGRTRAENRQLRFDRKYLLKRRRDLGALDDMTELERILKASPELRDAYELKELFYDIHDNATSESDARRRWANWLELCPKKEQQKGGNWFELVQAMTNWEDEVFAYFRYAERFTNAYTESMNRLIREIDRAGRGYSFEVLRARVLFGQEFKRKPVKHKLKPEIRELLDKGLTADGREFFLGDSSLYEELEDATYNVYGTEIESVALWLETHGQPDSD